MLRTRGGGPAAGVWEGIGMGRARSSGVLLVVLVLAALAAGIPGCGRDEATEASRIEAVRLAVVPWPASAAFYVAQDKGFFLEEGLDATLVFRPSGHLGLEDVLEGKVDLASAGETPLARQILAGRPLSVLATMAEIERPIRIIARKDRGIAGPADLRGRSVGITLGTTAEFFLHIYLATSGVSPGDVKIEGMLVEELIQAVDTGKVDAVCTWSPWTLQIKNRLGKSAVVLDDPAIYHMTWNLIATSDFASARSKTVEKVLRALIRANLFILENPDESLAVCTKASGTDFSLFREEWEDYTFSVALDQSLVLNLEDQARWMMRAREHAGKSMPDFPDFIRCEALEAVRPELVTIPGR